MYIGTMEFIFCWGAEKQIIEEPQKYYLGLASQKAKTVAAYWKNKL